MFDQHYRQADGRHLSTGLVLHTTLKQSLAQSATTKTNKQTTQRTVTKPVLQLRAIGSFGRVHTIEFDFLLPK